jgi:stearoyl-CoA desaturase (delta-9 desaturase)
VATTDDRRIQWRSSIPFLAAQAIPLLAFVTGVTRTAVVLFVACFTVRMFCITAGYHRYFSHRAYRVGRVTQALLAFGGTTAAQKGPLWWASNHRDHHRYADTDRDPHSPREGFWWSHVGWVLSGRAGPMRPEKIEDFARYPELRWLDSHDWVGPWLLGTACFLIGGWSGLVFGFFGSTVLLWHTTFTVNSVTHVWGRRRYATSDTSRNNAIVAICTLGEGWHNNHHHYPNAARQGFEWWEIDVTYYVLRALSFVGIVSDLRQPPRAVRSARRIRSGALDVGRFTARLARAAALLPPGEQTDELRAELAATAARAGRVARRRDAA